MFIVLRDTTFIIVDRIALKRHELKLTVFAFVFCIYAVTIYCAMKVRSISFTFGNAVTIGNSKFSLSFNFLSPNATKIKYTALKLDKKHTSEENKSSSFEIKCM